MKEKEEPYKVELIEDLPEDAEISFYQSGRVCGPLCRPAPHEHQGPVKAFKLTSLAGAYWRGNEKNKMLTRIYGTAFTKKAGAGRVSCHAWRRQRSGTTESWARELGTLHDERRGTGLPVLPAEGNGTEKHSAGLLERDPQQSRLCRRFPPRSCLNRQPVGDLRSLGSL